MGRETLPLASAIDHIHEDRQEAEHGAYSAPMRDLDQVRAPSLIILCLSLSGSNTSFLCLMLRNKIRLTASQVLKQCTRGLKTPL